MPVSVYQSRSVRIEGPDGDYYYKAKRSEFKCCCFNFRCFFLRYSGQNHRARQLKPTVVHRQITGGSHSFRISEVSSVSEISSVSESSDSSPINEVRCITEGSGSFRNSGPSNFNEGSGSSRITGARNIDGNRLCLANAPYNGDNWAIVFNE